jgi:hypothetical protein
MQRNTSWPTATPGLFCFCFQQQQSCALARVGRVWATSRRRRKKKTWFVGGKHHVMDDTDVCSKLLLHLYTSRVLKNAEVIYCTLLCHPILREKPCEMTKRCYFKFVFDDVEKHIDSFWCSKTPILMLKRTDSEGWWELSRLSYTRKCISLAAESSRGWGLRFR